MDGHDAHGPVAPLTPVPQSVRDVVLAGHRGDARTAMAAWASDDPSVRVAALGALARCGALTDAVRRAAAEDPAVAVRRRLAELAAQHPDVALGPLLDDPESSVVEVAAWASGEREQVSDAVLQRLIALAGTHEDALVREAAVAALGAIGDERGLPAILAACGDRPAVRRRAVLALAPFDGPEVEAALQRALRDRDWQVRQGAEDLLDPAR